ncbi:GNAT family N-acetyltransferase [Adhaeretor mobilis]|uniref:N-acetyltransferase domain-containing protein n=1 Tax=Adhaeretor mobilis TaxID=1930276 RepID=A0A517MWJ3_9BACT|nr:hypothetical protein HG15A2_25750 [Adhaeretor mobilis]
MTLQRIFRFGYRCLQRLIVLEGVSVLVGHVEQVSKITASDKKARMLSLESLQEHILNSEAPYCQTLVARIEERNLSCFGVESGGHLLSFAWFHLGSAEAGMNYGRDSSTATPILLQDNATFVFHAYTSSDARGKGLMSKVLGCAADSLRKSDGIKYLVATTEIVNDSAQSAFHRAGFNKAATYWRFGIGRWVVGKYPKPTGPILAFGDCV